MITKHPSSEQQATKVAPFFQERYEDIGAILKRLTFRKEIYADQTFPPKAESLCSDERRFESG